MDFPFDWNEFADQPHNVAPRAERLKHHIRRADGYAALLAWNVWTIGRAWLPYRRLRKRMHLRRSEFKNAFGCAVSPLQGRDKDVLSLLAETGVRQTLVRVPSWERHNLARLESFIRRLRGEGFDVLAALLQNRNDVLNPGGWREFLDEAFTRLGPLCSAFEVGHAWNRTKWGVWDYGEYLDLAAPAFGLAGLRGLKLVGPAVIDFEFHLYPPTLAVLPFDTVSSLLYVDRAGAPENGQAGWTAADKVCLLKAMVEAGARRPSRIWITEVNWPLQGTGPYSPASGRPNVTEDEQADYLVRYHVLCLSGGYIDRVYWWQLIAPGYGLADSREGALRRRPAFLAYKTMVGELEGAVFLGREASLGAEIFHFERGQDRLAVCWTPGRTRTHDFGRAVRRVIDRDGRETKPSSSSGLELEGSPVYVFF